MRGSRRLFWGTRGAGSRDRSTGRRLGSRWRPEYSVHRGRHQRPVGGSRGRRPGHGSGTLRPDRHRPAGHSPCRHGIPRHWPTSWNVSLALIRHQMARMMLAQGACQVESTSERIWVRQNRTRARLALVRPSAGTTHRKDSGWPRGAGEEGKSAQGLQGSAMLTSHCQKGSGVLNRNPKLD